MGQREFEEQVAADTAEAEISQMPRIETFPVRAAQDVEYFVGSAEFVDRGRFLTALLAAQREFTAAPRDSRNDFLKKNYASYASVHQACMPALHEQGFVVTQHPRVEGELITWDRVNEDGQVVPHGGFRVTVTTLLQHRDCVYTEENSLTAVSDGVTGPDVARATTLLRRHSLMLLVNLPVAEAESDDRPSGQQASAPRRTPTQERQRQPAGRKTDSGAVGRIRELAHKSALLEASEKGEIRELLRRVSLDGMSSMQAQIRAAMARCQPGSVKEQNYATVDGIISGVVDEETGGSR